MQREQEPRPRWLSGLHEQRGAGRKIQVRAERRGEANVHPVARYADALTVRLLPRKFGDDGPIGAPPQPGHGTVQLDALACLGIDFEERSEEHTSELQSL